MKTVELKTNGTHCQGCARRIQASVAALDGVEAVNADHATERATVEYDPDRVSVDDIVGEIVKTGYGAEILG